MTTSNYDSDGDRFEDQQSDWIARRMELLAETDIGHGPCEGCGDHKADVCRIGRGSDTRDVCRNCWRTKRDPGYYGDRND